MPRLLTSSASARLLPLVWLASVTSAGCGVEQRCTTADLAPMPDEVGFAVVTSDYGSTALALLGRDGTVVTEAWVDSGTVAAGITAALGGDVVLPSEPLGRREVAFIDRLGVDVLTMLALDDGEVKAQLRTQLPTVAGTAGYRANPQDAVPIGDDALVVSRLEPNHEPHAAELDRGNDLLVLRRDSGAFLGRISLAVLDGTVDGELAYARPAHLARAGSHLVIGTMRMTTDFMATAEGAIGLVDGERLATAVAMAAGSSGLARLDDVVVRPLRMDGLESCTDVRVIPGNSERVAVLCSGPGFGDVEARRRRAGIAIVELGDDPGGGEATVVATWRGDVNSVALPPSNGLIPISDQLLVFVAMGKLNTPEDPGEADDQLQLLDLRRGETAVLLEAAPFSLGRGAYDEEQRLVVIPDGDRMVIHRYEFRADDSVVALASVPMDGCRGLPPREIVRVAP